jgi:hypothetical protein
VKAVAIVAALALAGCAIDETKPDVEVRTITVKVPTPVPVPCFTESDRPVMPKPTFTTEAEIAAATPEQLAAADRADRLALEVYVSQVDALWLACQSKGNSP